MYKGLTHTGAQHTCVPESWTSEHRRSCFFEVQSYGCLDSPGYFYRISGYQKKDNRVEAASR